MIKKSIVSYEFEIASNAKKNPRRVYAYMNNKSKFKEGITSLKVGDTVLNEKLEFANVLSRNSFRFLQKNRIL